MIKMTRNKEPQYLSKNKNKWTEEYFKKQSGNFYWYGKSDNILEELKVQTLNHCAFCDRAMAPIGDADEEIEHFKPKSKFPKLAYEWTNLYPICPKCNKIKGNRFDELLLRPDENNYDFDKWFWYNPLTGELDVKFENKENKRAEETVKLYGLNRKKLVERRKYQYNKIVDSDDIDISKQAFRFIKNNTTI